MLDRDTDGPSIHHSRVEDHPAWNIDPQVRVIGGEEEMQLGEPVYGGPFAPTTCGEPRAPRWEKRSEKRALGEPCYGHSLAGDPDVSELRRGRLQEDLGHWLREWMEKPMPAGGVDEADLGPRPAGRPRRDAPVSRLLPGRRLLEKLLAGPAAAQEADVYDDDENEPKRQWRPGDGFPRDLATIRAMDAETAQEFDRHYPDWQERVRLLPDSAGDDAA